MLTVRRVLDRFRESLPALDVQYQTQHASLHEAKLLQLDCAKAKDDLDWCPVWDSSTAIRNTADWYAAYLQDQSLKTSADLDRYISDALTKKIVWAEQ